jgi:hypothetical protein
MGPIAEAGWFGLGGVVIGSVLTMIGGQIQGRREAKERQSDRQHEETVRREERQQQRIWDAYATLQKFISQWERSIGFRATVPLFEGESAPPLDDVSEDDEARASLVASNEVRKLMNDYLAKLTEARVALGALDKAEKMVKDGMPEARCEVTAAKDALKEIATALNASAEEVHQEMRRELAGLTDLDAVTPTNSTGG